MMNDLNLKLNVIHLNESHLKSFNYGAKKIQLKNTIGISFDVDWKHWLSSQEWTPMQAVCLLYEVCPDKSDKVKINKYLIELRLQAEDKGNMMPYEWRQFGIEYNGYVPKRINNIKDTIVKKLAKKARKWLVWKWLCDYLKI